MSVNKMAGVCLIVLGIVNVLHEIVVRSTGRGEPGNVYALVTALFFTFGAAQTSAPKAKGPSIFKD
jgi:hypothetical protein